jgi:hypothetical protein
MWRLRDVLNLAELYALHPGHLSVQPRTCHWVAALLSASPFITHASEVPWLLPLSPLPETP